MLVVCRPINYLSKFWAMKLHSPKELLFSNYQLRLLILQDTFDNVFFHCFYLLVQGNDKLRKS